MPVIMEWRGREEVDDGHWWTLHQRQVPGLSDIVCLFAPAEAPSEAEAVDELKSQPQSWLLSMILL